MTHLLAVWHHEISCVRIAYHASADFAIGITFETEPTTPTRLSWRALVGLTHLSFAHNLLWTALLVIVIPVQVVTMAGENSKDTALAEVLIVGALIAAVTQIVSGGLSDRATFRMGPRRPFIVAGALIGAVGLYLMGTAHSIMLLAMAFLVVQFGFNVGQSAYAALAPDLVVQDQRGSASGLAGVLAMLGSLAGAVLAGGIIREGDFASFSRVYGVIIAVNLLFTATTALVVREKPLAHAEPFTWSACVRSFWVSPRAHPDFAWVFVTRFLVMMGYFTVLDFLLYYVRDEVGRQSAASTVRLISIAVIVAAALTSFFAGRLSDRIGRKPVVYASGGFLAIVSLSFLITHTVGLAVVVGTLWGLAWGVYLSVDWALAVDVLPQPQQAGDASNFARYMGIWSLAITLPQIISPGIGPLIQFANDHSSGKGYTLMFGIVFVYFLLGAVLVRNVRTVR